MKTCSQCRAEKAEDQFSKHGHRNSAACKGCKRRYEREHYVRNKQYYRDRNKRSLARSMAILLEAKNKPCTDCGVVYPACVMEFDHLSTKRYNVAQAVRMTAPRLLMREIAKCELVCANCHRMRTCRRSFHRHAEEANGSQPAP